MTELLNKLLTAKTIEDLKKVIVMASVTGLSAQEFREIGELVSDKAWAIRNAI